MTNRFSRWSVKFDEDGGYDCMSAAYLIIAEGKTMMKVDVADFVGEAARGVSDSMRHDMLHAEDEGAANLAQFIVNALNLHGL